MVRKTATIEKSINTKEIQKQKIERELCENLGDGYYYARQGDHEKAIICFENILKTDPLNPYASISLGTIYFEQNDFLRAVKYSRIAVDQIPDDNEFKASLAVSLLKSKDSDELDEGESLIRQVILDDPDHLLARLNLGIYLGRVERTEEAILELQNIVNIDPNFAKAHLFLSIIYKERGLLEQAEKEKKIAYDLEPEFTNSLLFTDPRRSFVMYSDRYRQ